MADKRPVRHGGIIEPGKMPVIGDDSGHEQVVPGTPGVRKGALMANVTLKVNAEMTEQGKTVIREAVAEVLQEAASGVTVQFASKEDLAAFVRAEVRKALAEELRAVRMQAGGPR